MEILFEKALEEYEDVFTHEHEWLQMAPGSNYRECSCGRKEKRVSEVDDKPLKPHPKTGKLVKVFFDEAVEEAR